MHLEELRALLRGPQRPPQPERVALLEEVERMLAAGVPANGVMTMTPTPSSGNVIWIPSPPNCPRIESCIASYSSRGK